jgi:hypothetical protein
MNTAPYVQWSPQEIDHKLHSVVKNRLVSAIVTPTIFQATDGKILFVGNVQQNKLKLPNQLTVVDRRTSSFSVESRTRDLSRFCLSAAGEKTIESDYLGLIRHKAFESRLIVPVVANLADESDSEWLSPSRKWMSSTMQNRDHFWANIETAQNMLTGEERVSSITVNTQTIVNFFLQTSAVKESP